jgi:hypothetical protein
MPTVSRPSLLLLCALGLAAPACAGPRVNTPAGFATLGDDDHFSYRAASAEGVVLAVRVERNRPEGNLAFWSRVVDERMQSRGYVPDGDPRPVQSADGLAGTQYRYRVAHQGRAHRYWVAVFVKPGGFLSRSRVYVVEAGGDQEVFDPAAAAVERAMASFRR